MKLVAERRLDEPKTVHVVEAVPNKAAIGKKHKAHASKVVVCQRGDRIILLIRYWLQIITRLAQMSLEEVEDLDKTIQQLRFARTFPFLVNCYKGWFSKVTIDVGGQSFELEKDLVEVKRYDQNIHIEDVHPSVIEPSFGEIDSMLLITTITNHQGI